MIIESVRGLRYCFVVILRRVGKLRKRGRDFLVGGSFELRQIFCAVVDSSDSG